MPIHIHLLLITGTLCAAAGQVFFKLGAAGRGTAADFVNAWIASGLLFYGLGTVLWVYSLSRAKLTSVYPYTALTFVLVYAAGVLLLGEPASVRAALGITLVLAGLFLVTTG